MNDQHLLTPGPLLDEQGNLAEAGYAFSLVKDYDRSAIKANSMRIKEWDYYYIGNASYGVALTVDDNSYMGMVSISVLDFKAKKDWTKSIIIPFTKGKVGLPSTSKEGDIVYENEKKGFSMKFLHTPKGRRLVCFMQNFNGKEAFHCDIYLEPTTPHSMVIATPFKKKGHFYYNQKINNLLSSGYAKMGERFYDLNGSYGVLDWGRGVWTYKNTWYWSSLNSFQNGVPIGWNLGYGFGDTSKASENMIFVGKEVYKLGQVIFDIPISPRGGDAFMDEWTIRSKDGSLFVRFTPVYDRHADTNLLVLRSNQHQVFGTFSGLYQAEGKTIEFSSLPGFAEKVFNKW